MAFETGNPQFNFLLKRARSRRQTADALKNNNIDVETSKEKMEEGGESSDVSGGSQVGDIGGLSQSTGVGVTGTGFSQSIADANEMADRGVGGGKSVGEVAFGISKDKGIADFSASNPVGAAIAGYSSSKMAQTAVNMAPMGLAMAGQMGAARALSQVTSVMGGPIGSLAMGLVGPSMQDPYGNTVAMGSGMLGAVSNQVMGMHYGIAEKAAAGVPGYAGGTYNGTALSVSPGFFGGLTFTGVNAPDIHSYSPTDFMNDLAAEKAYSASVEPFGGVGTTSIGGQGISVDTFSSPTQAAQNNTGYSSYGPTGVATGAAPPGSQHSSTGIFSSPSDDNNNNNDNDGTDGGYGGSDNTSDYGGTRFGGKITKKKKMAMGDVVEQNPEVVQGVGFIDHDNNATPQEEIKDDKPLEAKEGDFIINAPAAELMGKQDVEEMISVAVTSLQEKGVDVQIGNPEISTEDNVKLLVSKNEVYIPKVIAEEIGYDKLEKINNRGKKEVSRRQQEESQSKGVAEGGFIGMADGDVVTGMVKDRPTDAEPKTVDDPYAGMTYEELREKLESYNTMSKQEAAEQNTNPQTPFSKYASTENPKPNVTKNYKTGVELGDVELGMDLLNKTSWNKLLQAGLRDDRSLSDFVNQLKSPKKIESSPDASGYFDSLTNKIALGTGNRDSLSGRLMTHELMHKGANLLGQDPNYRFVLPEENVHPDDFKFADIKSSPNFSNRNKNIELIGKAEHRYIQSVVNQAFVNEVVSNKENFDTKLYAKIIKKYPDMTMKMFNERLPALRNSALTNEITRVFKLYMSPENRSLLAERAKDELGIDNLVDVISGKPDGETKSRNLSYEINTELSKTLSFDKIKALFQISNEVMASDFSTMLFEREQNKAAKRSSRTFKGDPNFAGVELAKGGFIGMADGDVVTDDDDGGMDIMEQMNPNTIKKIKGLMKRGINRGSIEALIDNLPDREALALTIFSESIVSKDSSDSMRAIGETVLNRVNDKTYSFKNQNTLKDVLKSRSNKGEGSKMFSYEGLEPKYLTPRLPEMLNNKYWQKALDAADNALETEPDMEQYKLRDDVFTYGRVGEASDRLKSNKRNEYLTTIGEHDFYSRTPEKGGGISSETMGESSEFYR